MGNSNTAHHKLKKDVDPSYCPDEGTDNEQKLPPKNKRSRYKVMKKRSNRDLHVQSVVDFHRKSNGKRTDHNCTNMIPEPDYSDSEEENEGGPRHPRVTKTGSSNGIRCADASQISPKKVANPCLESVERQNLHRELLFNQKIGKNVLGQKSELQKVMDKFREDQKKKELEEEKLKARSAFEMRLEEQANKLKQQEEQEIKKEEEPLDQPEFLRVHARVCAQTLPVDSKLS